MGLFSKKPKKVEIDLEKSNENKKKMREIFNNEVEDGDTYKIIHAGSSDSSLNKGLILDTRVTTFHNFIVGYRQSDFSLAIIEVNQQMTQHSEPNYVDIDEIKGTNYYPKQEQAWFIYLDSSLNGYGLKFGIHDNPDNAPYMTPSINQTSEREEFLDFLEAYTKELNEMGFKTEKWKR